MIANPNTPKIIGLSLAISFGKKEVRFIPKYERMKSKIAKPKQNNVNNYLNTPRFNQNIN